MSQELSLDQQLHQFQRRRFLAMPLAGTIAWAVIAMVCAFVSSPIVKVYTVFIATGLIAYLGMFISRYTGENFLDKTRPKNFFDRVFLATVGMSALVYAIAIPFFLVDYTTLVMTVGVLTGIMWLPLTVIVKHWVFLFHALTRTFGVVALWYAFPDYRFTAIPLFIIIIYVITIVVLERRWRDSANMEASTL